MYWDFYRCHNLTIISETIRGHKYRLRGTAAAKHSHCRLKPQYCSRFSSYSSLRRTLAEDIECHISDYQVSSSSRSQLYEWVDTQIRTVQIIIIIEPIMRRIWGRACIHQKTLDPHWKPLFQVSLRVKQSQWNDGQSVHACCGETETPACTFDLSMTFYLCRTLLKESAGNPSQMQAGWLGCCPDWAIHESVRYVGSSQHLKNGVSISWYVVMYLWSKRCIGIGEYCMWGRGIPT